MTWSGCGAACADVSVRLRRTWFDSRPTTFVGVVLWRTPFHWGNPDGRPGSTPGPGMCRGSSMVEHPAASAWLEGRRFDSFPLRSRGSSSAVEHQHFRMLEVARFKPRLPHFQPCGPNGAAVLSATVRTVDGASSTETGSSNNTGNLAEAQHYKAYRSGPREKVLLSSRGSIPRTAIFCGCGSVVERRGVRSPEVAGSIPATRVRKKYIL